MMENAAESTSNLPDLGKIDLGSVEEHHEDSNQRESEAECGDEGIENEGDTKKQSTSQYSHPVYRELSKLNGEINRLSVPELKRRLRENKLNLNGKKDVLQKRLRNHVRLQKLDEAGIDVEGIRPRKIYYDYYLVIDFEATCDSNVNTTTYRHEIIEFPAQLICTKRARIISHFHSYVRPLINPRLTTFCTNLTGITQDMVNFAPSFPEVLNQFETWLEECGLTSSLDRVATLTDGPWDMSRFLLQQCSISKVPFPRWGKTWINVKKTFSNFHKTKKMSLKDMLSHLGMGFQGQLHSGLDDSKNIARVAIRLLKDGANMRVNERIHIRKDGSYDPRERVVFNISRHNFEGTKKKLLSANDKDECSSDKIHSGNVSNSDSEESQIEESEPLYPNTGDIQEFPELVNPNSIQKT